MFDDKKESAKWKKEREKIRKHAMRKQAAYDRKRKEAEKIKDEDYVQQKLAQERIKDEEAIRKRDQLVHRNLQAALGEEVTSFKCKYCRAEVSLSNLTCPNCGHLYCQYCGAPMDMENPGKCPRCGGAPMYTPAELVVTRVEDVAPEDRFWEELPSCPKCGAAIQPDWDSCPFCNARFKGAKSAPRDDAPDTGVWTEADSAKQMEETANENESAKAYKKRMRKEQKKKGKRGV
jgi:hypothetical protein